MVFTKVSSWLRLCLEASIKMCEETCHLNKRQYRKLIVVSKNAEWSTSPTACNTNPSSCSLQREGGRRHRLLESSDHTAPDLPRASADWISPFPQGSVLGWVMTAAPSSQVTLPVCPSFMILQKLVTEGQPKEQGIFGESSGTSRNSNRRAKSWSINPK